MANCYLTENVKASLDKGNVVGAVFLSKQLAGLHPISNQNSSSFKINAEYSTRHQSTMGIPQGSIL